MAKYVQRVEDEETKKGGRAREHTPPGPPATVPQVSLQEELPRPSEKKYPAEIIIGGKVWEGGKSEKSGEKTKSAARYVSNAAPSAASAPAPGADLAFHMPEEDGEARLRYENALAELAALRESVPRYDSRYDAQIRDLYAQITSRAPFRYDSATDPLYQQYRQDYTAQGRMAMRDTMAQAAALTGGYGSSYAQSVGQQQYGAYLQRLAEVLPETYGMALDAWQAEGEELQRRYGAAAALEQSAYQRYLDELGQYNRGYDRARSDAESAYERMIAGEEKAYSRAVDDYERRRAEDERSYRRRKDAGLI